MHRAPIIYLAVLSFAADPPLRAPRYPDRSRLLVLRDAAGGEKPITTAAEWAERRAHIVLGMEEIMGPVAGPPGAEPPGATGRKDLPLDLRVEGEETLEKVVRKRISYLSEPESRVPAYLLVPRERRGKLPAVLCLHQTTAIGKGEPAGVGGKESLHYALELAARGYVTLAPDYPNFGDHRFDTYGRGYASGTMKAIRDNRRAVDLLVSLEEADPQRIGCMGHSLGGHNTLFTAVFEPRLRAMVSSCGFNAFRHYYHGDLKGWSSKTYMPAISSRRPEDMPFDFHEIVAALAPRPFLAIAPLHDANFEVEGVREVMASAAPVYRLLGAAGKLAAEYPDCEHDFPAAMREKAYAWLDGQLEKKIARPRGIARARKIRGDVDQQLV